MKVSNVYQQFSTPEEGSVRNIIDFSIWPLLQVLTLISPTISCDRAVGMEKFNVVDGILLCRKEKVHGHVWRPTTRFAAAAASRSRSRQQASVRALVWLHQDRHNVLAAEL